MASLAKITSPSQAHYLSLPNNNLPEWKEVIVLKKNEKGEILTDKNKKPLQFSYVEDSQTGDLYNDDDRFTVAFKCALIFIGTPLFVAGVMAWNAAKIFVDIARVAFRALSQLCKIWSQQGAFEALKLSAKYFICNLTKAVVQDLWHIIRAPIYGLGMQLCAVYGIIDPYNARKVIAELENHWQDGIPAERDIRELGEKEPCRICPILWKEEKNTHVAYLAHCFQVQGSRHDPKMIFLKYKG